MCGRYYIDININEINKIVAEAEKNIYENAKAGEVLPSDIAPIYIKEGKIVKLILAKWGFPKWNGNGLIINARSESIEKKVMFKSLIHNNRCIIPATAYFEWKESNYKKHKEKYKIEKPGSILYFAGLYNIFPHRKTKQISLFDANDFDICYTIITRDACSSISHIHDMMPFVIDKCKIGEWMGGKNIDEVLDYNLTFNCKVVKI